MRSLWPVLVLGLGPNLKRREMNAKDWFYGYRNTFSNIVVFRKFVGFRSSSKVVEYCGTQIPVLETEKWMGTIWIGEQNTTN